LLFTIILLNDDATSETSVLRKEGVKEEREEEEEGEDDVNGKGGGRGKQSGFPVK
jgi:hypothetical protein